MSDARLKYDHRLIRMLLWIFIGGYVFIAGLRFCFLGLRDWPLMIFQPFVIILFGYSFAYYQRYETICPEVDGVRLTRPKGKSEMIPYTDIDQYYVNTRTFILRRSDGKEVTILRHHYPAAEWEKFLPVFRTLHDRARSAEKAAGPGLSASGQVAAAA